MTRTRQVEGGPATAVDIVGYDVPPAGATGDISTPAANTEAEITYPRPGVYCYHAISGVAWSYDGQIAGGNLQIVDEYLGVTFDIDIINSGLGLITFPVPKRSSLNATMTILLASGGAGINGKLNVLTHWIESIK